MNIQLIFAGCRNCYDGCKDIEIMLLSGDNQLFSLL